MEPKQPSMTCAEAGRRGGQANAARHDHEHFVRIGRKAGQRTAELVRRGLEAIAEDEKRDQ